MENGGSEFHKMLTKDDISDETTGNWMEMSIKRKKGEVKKKRKLEDTERFREKIKR